MIDEKITDCPTIIYRPIQPTDLQSLEQIHARLFPIRYELEFFLNVVNGCRIVSWAAVDDNSDNSSRELLFFDSYLSYLPPSYVPQREQHLQFRTAQLGASAPNCRRASHSPQTIRPRVTTYEGVPVSLARTTSILILRVHPTTVTKHIYEIKK